MRRAVSMLVSGALLVGIAGAAYWAGTNAVVPPELPVAAHTSETYTVEIGTVGRSVRVSVAATWSTTRTLYGTADGIVTSIGHQAGNAAQPGDVLLTVNLEPVVVARGVVPMFRTLEQGVDGPDVAQFQRLLRDLEFFPGPTNGAFGPATAAATKRWQRSIGATADGTVESGSLLFVDALPARMAVVPSVGARIGAGTELVRVLGHTPRFHRDGERIAASRAEIGPDDRGRRPGRGHLDRHPGLLRAARRRSLHRIARRSPLRRRM